MTSDKISVTILVPTFNEEKALPATVEALKALDPQPDQILVVDGGSADSTLKIATDAGFRTLISTHKGRGAQINKGVAVASGEVVCVLHADTTLPTDGVQVIRDTMADKKIALASFTPRLGSNGRTRWGSTFHNWIKTWYAPLLTHPILFMRGTRLLFGDHAMFFRKADFLATGGCDERLVVMEEAGMCINLSRLGRVKMVPRWAWTSDRRITEWGRWRANWIYLKVGLMWSMGVREKLNDHYPDIR